MVSALDVTATILDALGAPALPNSPGRSLLGLIDGSDAGESEWEDVAFSEYCSDQFCPDGGCYQRMIRAGDWKLVYYHGQPPQLFNLADDPDELTDRADDPNCEAIRTELTERVLDDWDPEWVKAKMADKKADVAIMKAWTGNVKPPDLYRWPLKPEMNYLDDGNRQLLMAPLEKQQYNRRWTQICADGAQMVSCLCRRLRPCEKISVNIRFSSVAICDKKPFS